MKYYSIFKAESLVERDGSLKISGLLIDDTTNVNGWSIPKEEFQSIADKLCGLQIRVDHGRRVSDIVGGVTRGWVDGNSVLYEGEIDDPAIIRKILKKRVTHASISAICKNVICSECSHTIIPSKMCKCENSHEILKEVIPKEVSLVSEPAYEDAKFTPLGFVAGVDEILTKIHGDIINTISQKKEEEKTDMSVNTTPPANQDIKEETKKTDAILNLSEHLTKSFGDIMKKLDDAVLRIKKLEEDDEEEKKKEKATKEPEEDEEEEEEVKKSELDAFKIEMEKIKKENEDLKRVASSATKVDNKDNDISGKVLPERTATVPVKTGWEAAMDELKAEAKKRLG